ncbi:MAG: hypothetical protein K1Y02_12040 [Candidatus Hydrogenedentes bacterium]|nr:hypothetical protein [Candidatus Hydrogenedentota bacterium]
MQNARHCAAITRSPAMAQTALNLKLDTFITNLNLITEGVLLSWATAGEQIVDYVGILTSSLPYKQLGGGTGGA